MNTNSQYAATCTLLFLLVIVDLMFMMAHVLHVWSPWLASPSYSIEVDRGIAETYQYTKLFWLTVCTALVYIQTRKKVFICWTILFGFLLLDDAAQIHEQIGFWLGQEMMLPAIGVLRPDDIGELLFAGFVGLTVIGGIGLTLWKDDTATRTVTRDLLFLVFLLAFFGVGVDLLHVAAYFGASQFSGFLALVEDGGEMVIVSCLTAYAFDIVSNGGEQRINLVAGFRFLRATNNRTVV